MSIIIKLKGKFYMLGIIRLGVIMSIYMVGMKIESIVIMIIINMKVLVKRIPLIKITT